MSMRFLHIKRAYVTDALLSQEVDRDVISNTLLLEKIYGNGTHDTCAVTEDGEWLMQGRKVHPAALLNVYANVFVYIHSPNGVYDQVMALCTAHAERSVFVYKATDVILHHMERLATLIKTQGITAKIPHQVHLDMQAYNADFTSSEDIASKYIRHVFLPVLVVPSLYRHYTPDIHTDRLAHTHAELTAHIDHLRHTHAHITLREYVQGDHVYVVSIPHFRNEDVYITMPIVSKRVDGLIHFQEALLGKSHKEEMQEVVEHISHVLFKKNAVIYKLKVHGKRGVFVEASTPAYFFILHNHDFLFTLASSHGVGVRELFEAIL